MKTELLSMFEWLIKEVLRVIRILWQIFWAFMAFMFFMALLVNFKGPDGPSFLMLLFTVGSFILAMGPAFRKQRAKKKTESKPVARPIELEPALHGAKWKLLERVDSPERLAYYVGLYKLQVRHDSSPVTELDTCRFLRDAIIECREESIGAKSHLVQLMRQGNTHIERLEGKHRDLMARIQTYTQDKETVPENLLSAKARLEGTLEQLRSDYAALVQELKRLRQHFDQFEGQIDFLNDTEADLILLQRIDHSLGQTAHYRDTLPAGQLARSWEIGQRFYALACQTEEALNGLAINLAVKEPTVEGMDAMLAQIVAKTSRIQNPFPLS